MKVFYQFIFIFLFFNSCKEQVEVVDFDFFLNTLCMIVNYEHDNTIEGAYLKVQKFSKKDSTLIIDLPDEFYINNDNCNDWIIGWGNNKPLYDAGVENLRSVVKIIKNKVYLGKILRGEGYPIKNQRIVFWNISPSGFQYENSKPIINSHMWKTFNGQSLSFGSVEYDSILAKWVMIVNESDTLRQQIYAAVSDDLTNWEAACGGNPIFTAKDFNECSWIGYDKNLGIEQVPLTTDIVRRDGKWFLFMDGYSVDGKRHIGLAVSKESLLGPYKVYDEPILSPGKSGSWNDEFVFFCKVEKYKEGYIMFYDGKNSNDYERIGMAFSKDLIHWSNFENNPVLDQHTGWRSATVCTEPSFVEIRNDTIFLMVEGVKKFKMGPWHHYVTKRMYMDKSGNVDDTQLGVYFSVDGGQTFIAHKNNPVFINNYSNLYENEHMGGNFRLIETDTAQFIFYQAKSSYEGNKYNIMCRIKYR